MLSVFHQLNLHSCWLGLKVSNDKEHPFLRKFCIFRIVRGKVRSGTRNIGKEDEKRATFWETELIEQKCVQNTRSKGWGRLSLGEKEAEGHQNKGGMSPEVVVVWISMLMPTNKTLWTSMFGNETCQVWLFIPSIYGYFTEDNCTSTGFKFLQKIQGGFLTFPP